MMEPVAKLTEKNIEIVARKDTVQLAAPVKAIFYMQMFSPERGSKGDAG